MATGILGSINKVINQTATEIISSDITNKTADLLSTAIKISFSTVDNVLKSIQDLTKES